MIKRYNISFLLMVYAGFACAYDEGTYGDYKQMQADRAAMIAAEKAAQKAIKKQSWVRREIIKPLKAKVREQLQPTVEFLEQKIKEEEPAVAADRAVYGHIKRMEEYGPEHEEWRQKVKENAAYAAANPIILKSDIPERDAELQSHLSNLAYNERKLYQEKLALEKKLQELPFYVSRENKEKLKDKLAHVRYKLEEIDTTRELMPMYKAHMHMYGQDVRQKRFDKYKKDIAHPTDRFISQSAFERGKKLSHGAPPRYDYLYGRGESEKMDEMIDYWRAKIHHADQSGMPRLYRNMDQELAKRVYHGSDKLLEDAINKSEAKYDSYYWEWRRDQLNKELQKLEKQKQKRKRQREQLSTPKVQQGWYAYMLEKVGF
jgi:hypothetical protein